MIKLIKFIKSKFHKININKNLVLITIAVVSIAFTGFLIFSNNNNASAGPVAEKAIDFMNKNVIQKGKTATLVDFSKESGVIKMKVKTGSNTYNIYATKDGKLLFPQGLPIDSRPKKQTAQNSDSPSASLSNTTKQTCDSLQKTDKPLLEAYVVSKCPFGLQMQRAMADAVKKIPSLEEFTKVRYIGDIVNGKVTAMHGEPEAKENLMQICIREEQNNKYWDYISCHIKDGDVEGCLDEVGIDQNKLNTCMKDEKRGLAYAKEDFDLNEKYNIRGSPTLILNGQEVNESDFGGRSSQAIKEIISCSSKTKPDFASKKLNSEQAATSFSPTYSKNPESSINTAPNNNNTPACAPS